MVGMLCYVWQMVVVSVTGRWSQRALQDCFGAPERLCACLGGEAHAEGARCVPKVRPAHVMSTTA